MRRWVICCAMALAANGWAETRTDEVRVPGTSWRSFNVPKEGDDLVLDVVPKQCWTITGSRITRQEDADDIVWKFDANASNPDLHRYRTYLKPAEAAPGSVFSSREWICVTGAARRTCGGGGGGGPAKFKVEVTATDVDVDGADNEATEEIAGVFICVDTNAVLPPRKAVYVRPVQPTPQVGNQTLKWPAAISMWELIWHNVNGKWHGQEIKLEGNSVSLPADEERTYWIQGETPAADVYLELEHTNEDNQRRRTRLR